MKKLITWLTKGSKVTRILKYIYQALVIANKTATGVIEGINEAEVSSADKINTKISDTQDYLTMAIEYLAAWMKLSLPEYLGIILGWFGITVSEKDVIDNTNEETTAKLLRDSCQREIG